jgi:hypothetical protein
VFEKSKFKIPSFKLTKIKKKKNQKNKFQIPIVPD